jgi:hypothetical protein
MQLKFNYILVIMICFLLGLYRCGNKSDSTITIPPNILNETEFTKLLTGFALAESASNMNIKNIPLYKFDSVYAFNPLLENKVRKSQYDSTVNFYIHNPELYKKVYENVLVALTQMQTQRSALKADSIAK